MYKDIKDLLDVELKHLKFDKKLYKQLKNFRMSWSRKSDAYLEFLGGKTLGVQPIRFSSLDDESLFTDILNLDIAHITTEVYKVEGINKNWKISSNPVYLTLTYMMHRFINSKDIGSKIEDAITELHLIFSYKVIGSLISHYFPYDANPAIAKSVVEKLSNKYLIKKLDNWQEVFTYRARDMLPKKGLHYEKLKRFTTDDAIRVVNDAQGRIRDMCKYIYVVMIDVINNEEIITSTSLIEKGEDGDSTGSIVERPDQYLNYIRSIYSVEDTFIDDDLVHLVADSLPTLDKQYLSTTLRHISENINIKPGSKDDILAPIVVSSINYLNDKEVVNDYQLKIVLIIKLLKGYYGSSGITDKDLKHTKVYLYKTTKTAINKKSKWVISSVVIGVMIYIFLRAILKHK